MCDLFCLQIDQYKTFQDIVIKDEVDIIVFLFRMNMLLPGDKGISLSHLHQELLQIANNALFQIRLQIGCIFLHAKEFSNDRVLYEFKFVLIRRCQHLHFLFHRFRLLSLQHAIIILR